MLERLRVVLVRPRRSGNVGAAARAMKNMGFADLALVAPRARIGRTAERMAVHAGDVLAARREVATLEDAVADCVLVVGTTARARARGAPVVLPRRAALEASRAASRGRVAFVFGPEDKGLSNAELDLCQLCCRIPTAGTYGSLNLAQAVLLVCYEVARRHGASAVPSRPAAAARARERSVRGRTATSAEREAMLDHLGRALDAVGFLSRQSPELVLRDLRAVFARAGLSHHEVRIWRGIARQVLWASGRAGLSEPARANGRTRPRRR